ncbi:hypothetical protein AM1_0669 [Acaryochloris marina MBIC11017]|uniref:Uncharacterized protein n=1 Tax=Acaryochloris marina (strain MBIC 11017) TaxID=329726 RepID=B0CE83_ACAM1|nr:hypothetical protein AM1_0669 [Acaryochloris marina MBIC11017]
MRFPVFLRRSLVYISAKNSCVVPSHECHIPLITIFIVTPLG